jgi:hypothetical protein
VLTDYFGAQTTVGIFGVAGLILTAPLALAWRRARTSRAGEDGHDFETQRAEHA